MTSLIAMISSGKGTWGQVSSLMRLTQWDKIILICNDFSYENYKVDTPKILKLRIDPKDPQTSIDNLSKVLKKEIPDFEVGLNLSSGDGMEHMIVISAILKAGLGMRFLYADFNELKEMKIFDNQFILDEETF